MDVKRELHADMENDREIVALMECEEVAVEFYGALCNTVWSLQECMCNEDSVVNRLKGIDKLSCSYSWRRAGDIIAKIRNDNYNLTEDYMYYYLSSNGGTVTSLVEKCFNRLGWIRCDDK